VEEFNQQVAVRVTDALIGFAAIFANPNKLIDKRADKRLDSERIKRKHVSISLFRLSSGNFALAFLSPCGCCFLLSRFESNRPPGLWFLPLVLVSGLLVCCWCLLVCYLFVVCVVGLVVVLVFDGALFAKLPYTSLQ
jgi:hypothetical protein